MPCSQHNCSQFKLQLSGYSKKAKFLILDKKIQPFSGCIMQNTFKAQKNGVFEGLELKNLTFRTKNDILAMIQHN
jgi:hypothetical protein